jgi:CheY-like chemotaxis protein
VRILMIEDNESNACLARILLEQRGHEVTAVATGTQGVALSLAVSAHARPADRRPPPEGLLPT